MPPVAAAGGAIAASMAGGITLAGVAQGMMIAGTGLGILGQITGSKTLSNIGMGMSGVGAVTSLGSSMSGKQPKKTSITGETKSATRLLDQDNIEDSLSRKLEGTKSMDEMKSFKPADTQSTSMQGFVEGAAQIGQGAGNIGMGPGMGGPWNTRISDTLRRYDTKANMLMGAGNAYMQTRNIAAQEDMQEKDFDFQREQIARQEANLTPGQIPTNRPGIQRTQNYPAVEGILRARGL